jgi:hypothetical protein
MQNLKMLIECHPDDPEGDIILREIETEDGHFVSIDVHGIDKLIIETSELSAFAELATIVRKASYHRPPEDESVVESTEGE